MPKHLSQQLSQLFTTNLITGIIFGVVIGIVGIMLYARMLEDRILEQPPQNDFDTIHEECQKRCGVGHPLSGICMIACVNNSSTSIDLIY